MESGYKYRTKQREAILKYMEKSEGAHLTAGQIAEYFKSQGQSVGLTTVYRHLDRLADMGLVHKLVMDGSVAACYQYAGQEDNANKLYHLMCEKCGRLIHLECDFLKDIENHVLNNHKFNINASKTVFYGCCQSCFLEGKENAGKLIK